MRPQIARLWACCGGLRPPARALPSASVLDAVAGSGVGEVVVESFGVSDGAEVSVAVGAVVDVFPTRKAPPRGL